MMGDFQRFWLFMGLLLLAGCASPMPQELRQPHISHATVAAARAHQVSLGLRVRWGGIITQVTNRPASTWIQIISKPLRASGRPRRDASGGGRFLARVPGFLDPGIYTPGRKITVVGVFAGFEQYPIGNYLYDFPIVRTVATYLWHPRPITPYYYGGPWPWGFGWVVPFGPGIGPGWHPDNDGPHFRR
ncbi:MAG TPA: Slp/YeaY family lipoprotein [Acidiferrobacter sp.]|nr:Slp/YeaY family lipoprotein [Acidiferrobacter sp.]